jgi:hypothetical protein
MLAKSKVLTSLRSSCPADKADHLNRLKDRVTVIRTEAGYLWSNECERALVVVICSGGVVFFAVWATNGEMKSRKRKYEVQYVLILHRDLFG